MAMYATAADNPVTPYKCLSHLASLPVWTAYEAALVLRCHVTTVRRELNRGVITGVRIANEWRIPASQFSALAGALRSLEHSEQRNFAARAPLHNDRTPPLSPVTPATSGASTTSTTAVASGTARTQSANHSAAVPETSRPVLRISLLGQPQIYIDDIRMNGLERSNRRSQLIQLLALHRGGLSGPQLASSLSIASHRYEEESLTPHYVRTLVCATREQARKRAGWDGIIESPIKRGAGQHHYKLPDNTVCDLWEFEDRLDQADWFLARGAGALRASMASMASGLPGLTRDPMPDEMQVAAIDVAAALREEGLQLYKGEFCEGSTNGCLVQAARILEERYIHSSMQQGDYWRTIALTWQWAQAARNSFAAVAATGGTGGTGATGATGVARDPTCALARPILPACSIGPEVRTIWREALRNYERVLRVDNYHEEAYIHAMECYAHLGNARGVDRMFNRCRQVLHADLAQAPNVVVVRAYRECKNLLRRAETICISA